MWERGHLSRLDFKSTGEWWRWWCRRKSYNSNFKTHISPLRFSLLFSSSAARNSARLFSLSLCFFFRALSLSRGFEVFFGRSVSRARDGKRDRFWWLLKEGSLWKTLFFGVLEIFFYAHDTCVRKKKAEFLSHARDDEWIITASFSLVLDRSIGKRRRKMSRIITMQNGG